ncbi:HTH domain-containing protein [Actinopolymorpha alba]|uniref:HTH domain-containing protein n=1 Tax=Actinopolymorpha alba TaxID=533267 RepID=UPI000382A149|nr:HTH domain-containing protein [Actinopolymorpha alba]
MERHERGGADRVGRALTFGVVGPADLVPRVADVVDATPQLRAVRLPYRQEQETVRILRERADDVDAWLFTGVVPHAIADAEQATSLPAGHVSYSGLTLLAALFRLAREGTDLTRISIDTLDPAEVSETLAEAGIAQSAAFTMVYEPSVRSRDVVAFHHDARERQDATVAITCLRSAYDVLRKQMPVVRLAPSLRDIRSAVDALALRTRNRHHSDAQVALGFIELENADPNLEHDLGELGGAVARIDAERYLLVTTRGPLERVTDEFRSAPFIERLAARHRVVQVGLGIGRSAGEAAANASRALARARAQGDVAAVLSAPHDADIVLAKGGSARSGPTDLGRLAQRLGMSRGTLLSLRQFVESAEEQRVTATELAQAFSIQERSARRLLKRLERAGAAVPIGTLNAGQMGRPPVIYRVDL